MSEKYRLVKHNKNLAEIRNNESVGLLFLVDEDCERKLRIIVDCLNGQQDKISELEEELEESSVFIIENKKLNEENEQLRKELDNFKPVMFQDMRKGTVILYSKGDIV